MKILWINCRLLHPLIGGDRIRTYQMLKSLNLQHHITYLCLRTPSDPDESVDLAREYCDEIIPIAHPETKTHTLSSKLRVAWQALFSSIPLIATKYKSSETSRRILEILEEQSFDLIICDYLAPFINLIPVTDKIDTPIVLFQHNVESLIWKRHQETSRNPLLKYLYYLQWRRTFHFEDVCAQASQGQIAVSEEESDYFSKERGMPRVLGAVPTGVDFDYFHPDPSVQEPHTIAFLGSMDWHANVDAILHFVKNILPLIRNSIPEIRFLIIGRNPTAAIKQLETTVPNIEVTGTIDDVRPALRRASIMILPLRVGGGTRIKIFEAMAMGVPVVSTTIGAEGLPITHGENILIANSDQELSDACIKLLKEPEFSQQIAYSARKKVEQDHSWHAVSEQFIQLCNSVTAITPVLRQ